MKLKWAFLARSAESGDDGTFYVLSGNLRKIVANRLPVDFATIAVVAKFEYEKEEPIQESVNLWFSLVSPKGEELLDISKDGTEVDIKSVDGSEPREATMILDIANLHLSEFGPHKLTMEYDSKDGGREKVELVIDVGSEDEDE